MRLAYLYPVLLLAAACRDPVEPGARTLEGVYALLDAPVILQGELVDTEILADTIRISGDSIAVRVVSMAHWDDTTTPAYSDWTSTYSVSLRLTRIEFALRCPPNALMALCTAPPHIWGLPGHAGLRLRHQSNPGVVLEYERISDLPGVQ